MEFKSIQELKLLDALQENILNILSLLDFMQNKVYHIHSGIPEPSNDYIVLSWQILNDHIVTNTAVLKLFGQDELINLLLNQIIYWF